VVEDLVSCVDGLTAEILPLENRTFGSAVTVSGLLTGEVLRESLRGKDLGDILFLPRAAFDEQGAYTLDDVSVDDLRDELSRPIALVDRLSQVLDVLKDREGGLPSV
jgi:NifB/MoaA-like Fe-S oxidoreductase